MDLSLLVLLLTPCLPSSEPNQSRAWRICNGSRISSRIPHQLPTRPHNRIRRFLHLFLSERPIPCIYRVADSGEESLVVAGPELGAEDDVFELGAVGNLFEVRISCVLC